MTALNKANGLTNRSAAVAPAGAPLHAVSQTTLGAITLPESNLYLHKVEMKGHATLIGGLALNYTGQHFARWPVAAACSWSYDVGWLARGQTIPAASLVAGAGTVATPTYYNFIFGKTPSPVAPPIDFYLCTASALQAATNVGVGVPTAFGAAINYDVGPATPRAMLNFAETTNFGPTTIYTPATGGFQFGAAAQLSTQTDPPDFAQCPRLPLANAITLLYGSTGTGNIVSFLYYTTA